MVQYLVDLPPAAASTLEIRRGMDSIIAEQYSAAISVHHAFLIELLGSAETLCGRRKSNVGGGLEKFDQKGMVH